MKKLLSIFSILLIVFNATGQECPNYYPLSPGSNWELTQFDKKDKVEGYSHVIVNSFINTDNGYVASLSISNSDAKSKDNGTAELFMKCENGLFFFDMRNFISPATMESYKDMEIEITATDMQYPNKLTVGEQLPDASITYKISSSGFAMMTMTIDITNRKIEGIETITTPAGTYEAYKISYNVSSKMGIANTSTTVSEYISPGFGVVKSETYSKKGELMGYSLLTKIDIK